MAQNPEHMPHEFPHLLELCDVFKCIYVLFDETEVGSNYFRRDRPLETGLASVLPGHGIIFIFRRGSQFEMIKHPTPISLPRLGGSLFLGILFLFWVAHLSGNGQICCVEAGLGVPDLRRISQKSRGFILKSVFLMFLKGYLVIPV